MPGENLFIRLQNAYVDMTNMIRRLGTNRRSFVEKVAYLFFTVNIFVSLAPPSLGKAIASLSVLDPSETHARNPDSSPCRPGLWSSIGERADAHDFRSNHPPRDSGLNKLRHSRKAARPFGKKGFWAHALK